MKRPLAALAVLLLAGCASGPDDGGQTSGPASKPGGDLSGSTASGSTSSGGSSPSPPFGNTPWPCDLCGVRTAEQRASEPAVALHPEDPDRIAVAAIEGSSVFVQGVGQAPVQGPGWAALTVRSSVDGGATWRRTPIPYAGTADPESAWSRYCVTADPVLEAVGDGLRLYGLGWPCTQGVLPSATAVGSIWMATSGDWGLTWSEPHTVVQSPGAAEWPDKEWAATDPKDPQRVVAVWMGIVRMGVGGYILRAAHSTDGGLTWSEPVAVTDSATEGGPATFSAMPAWGPDGRAHVAYRGCAGTCLKVASSSDLAQWAAVKVADVERVEREGGRAIGNWHPSMAATRDGLAVAWHGKGSDGSVDAHVALLGAGNWSAPLAIPGLDGLDGLAQDQWWPFVASTGNTVAGILYDRSEDDANLATRAVAWRLRLDDPSARILVAATGSAWNVTESSFAFYGDYIGAAASPRAFAAAWGQVADDGFRYIHAARLPL